MNGQLLLNQLRVLLSEESSSVFMDDLTSYTYLNEAATEIVLQTKGLRGSQTLTIVASQPEYTLNPDFLELYLMNTSKNHIIRVNDGSNNHFIMWRPYEEIVIADQSGITQALPDYFTIIDHPTLADQISGLVTAVGAATGGVSTLTDTSEDFSDVGEGDVVTNSTDGSQGYVLTKTSSTVLTTALFGGSDDDWTSGDSYVIQPQGRYQLIVDPPPSTAGYTVWVPYVQRPGPVYSSFQVFRLPAHYAPAMIKYAVWLYKYRDREPNLGDHLYTFFLGQVAKFKAQTNSALRRGRIDVRLKSGRRPRNA